MKKKYLIISITFSSILICLCLISETYAKYLTSANSITNAPIARWKILVNNEDITLGTTSENIITPIFPGNDNISEVVFPAFDIGVNATNVLLEQKSFNTPKQIYNYSAQFHLRGSEKK